MAGKGETNLTLAIRLMDKASPQLAALTAKLEATTAPFKAFGNQFDAFSKAANLGGISKAWGGVTSAAGGVANELGSLVAKFTGLAAIAGGAFYTMIHGAVEAGDKLAENSDRVGMTADEYASLQHAASLSDVGAEMFTASLDKLNKQMGDMRVGKGGEFLAYLNEISPVFAKQVKASKGNVEALELLTKAFAIEKDEQKRATLASHAFGKANQQMGAFLHEGTATIAARVDEYMRLRGSQNESAQAASDLDDATKRLTLAFGGAQVSLASGFYPALTKLAGKLTEFLATNRDSLAAWAKKTGDAFEKWIDSGGFERLTKSLGEIADSISKVVDWLGPWGTAMALGAVALGPLIGSVLSFGLALTNLGIVLFPLISAAAPGVWAAISAGGASFAALLAPVVALVGPIVAVFAAMTALLYLGKTIYDNWDALSAIFKDWGRSLKWAVLDAWATVRPILEKLSTFGPSFLGARAAVAAGDSLMGSPTDDKYGVFQNAANSIAKPAAAESKVTVDFKNLPPGARVSSPEGDQPVDVTAGWSMVMP